MEFLILRTFFFSKSNLHLPLKKVKIQKERYIRISYCPVNVL